MDMSYRRLGNSGLAVSVVGIGCNNFGRKLDQAGTRAVVDAAIDCGITLFDTADVYGDPHGASEELLGAALKANGRRPDVIVATKFGSPMGGTNGPDWDARGSRHYITRAVEASLRRLGTDHIDLYQIHQPDPKTPAAETLSALDDLIRAGKVRYVGSSNYSGWQVADAAWTARTAGTTPFVSAQNEYSLLERRIEADLVPACAQYGVGLLPYFPLANGLLTGKYRRDVARPVCRLPGSGAMGHDRADPGVRPGTFRVHLGRCHRWAGRPADRGLGDRRCHHPGPGPGQRRRGRLGAQRGRPHPARRDHPALTATSPDSAAAFGWALTGEDWRVRVGGSPVSAGAQARVMPVTVGKVGVAEPPVSSSVTPI